MKVFFATLLFLGYCACVIAQDSPNNTLKPGEYNAYQDAISLNAFMEIIRKLNIDENGVWVLNKEIPDTTTIEIIEFTEKSELVKKYGIRLILPSDVEMFKSLTNYLGLNKKMSSVELNQNIRMIVAKIISNHRNVLQSMKNKKSYFTSLMDTPNKENLENIIKIDVESSNLANLIKSNEMIIAKWNSDSLATTITIEDSIAYNNYKNKKEQIDAKIRELETQKLTIKQQLANIIATLDILAALEKKNDQIEKDIIDAFKIFNSIKILHLDNGDAPGMLANGSYSATPIRMEDVTRQIGLPSEEEAVRALSEFIMTRAQDELINSFLISLQGNLKTNIILQNLFPATLKLMKAESGTVPFLSQNRVNSVWIAAVSSDMQKMPLQILTTIDTLFPTLKEREQYNYFKAGIITYQLANMGEHPAEILKTLNEKIEFKGHMRQVLKFSDLLAQLYRRPASDTLPGYWLSSREVATSFTGKDSLFVTLLCKYYKQNLIQIFNLNNTISDSDLFNKVYLSREVIIGFTAVFEKSELLIRHFKSQIQEGKKITPENYLQYLNSLTDILVRCEDLYYQIRKTSFGGTLSNDYQLIYERPIYKNLKRAEHIYQGMLNKDYGSVIIEIIQIIEEDIQEIQPESFVGQLVALAKETESNSELKKQIVSIFRLMNNDIDVKLFEQNLIDSLNERFYLVKSFYSVSKLLYDYCNQHKRDIGSGKQDLQQAILVELRKYIPEIDTFTILSKQVKLLTDSKYRDSNSAKIIGFQLQLLSSILEYVQGTDKIGWFYRNFNEVLIQSMIQISSTKGSNYLQYQKALSQAVKIAGLFVDLMNSSTHKEIKQILHQYAAPLGSYSLKGRSHYTVTITSLPGFSIGGEYDANKHFFKHYLNNYMGLFGPLGIQGTIALSPYRRIWNPSIGLLLAPFDLGAAFSYPYSSSDSTSSTTKSDAPRFKDIFIPGAILTFNVDDKLPLSLGFGVQYSPQLRNNNSPETQILRYTAYLGVDVTLLKIWISNTYRFMKPHTHASVSWYKRQFELD